MIEIKEARAHKVVVGKDSLTVDLMDGRTITAPLLAFITNKFSDER